MRDYNSIPGITRGRSAVGWCSAVADHSHIYVTVIGGGIRVSATDRNYTIIGILENE
jgi:hypothetical protein